MNTFTHTGRSIHNNGLEIAVAENVSFAHHIAICLSLVDVLKHIASVDGAHHKQWYAAQALQRFGIRVEDPGIAP